MELPLEHPRFQTKRVTVKTAAFLGKPKLIFDSRELSAKKKTPHLVTDDVGEQATLELEVNTFDPIPTVLVDGEPHHLVPPMQWYEWLWVGIPFILIPIGGCVGGGIGGFAIALNVLVYRTAETEFKRWGLTFAITATAFAIALTLSTMAHVAMAG